MAYEIAPAPAPSAEFAVEAVPAQPRAPFEGFIQWQLNGVNLGDKFVEIIDFVPPGD